MFFTYHRIFQSLVSDVICDTVLVSYRIHYRMYPPITNQVHEILHDRDVCAEQNNLNVSQQPYGKNIVKRIIIKLNIRKKI